jgi:hypothetical protein
MIAAIRGNGKCAGTSGPPTGSPVLVRWLACIGLNSCTKLQINVQMFRIVALQQSTALQKRRCACASWFFLFRDRMPKAIDFKLAATSCNKSAGLQKIVS